MNRHFRRWSWVALLGWSSAARADYLIYPISDENIMVFEGQVTHSTGSTFRFSTSMGPLVFFHGDTLPIIKAPLVRQDSRSKLAAAIREKDSDAMYKAAESALRHGLLTEFIAMVNRILEVVPDHKQARAVIELKKKLDVDIPESESEVESFKNLLDIPNKNRMKVLRSKHFIMLHDYDFTAETREDLKRRSSPKRRMELLEQVYYGYMYFFALRGATLEIPKERMRQVLFSEESDYRHFLRLVHPYLLDTAGFWDPRKNIAYFYSNFSEALRSIDGRIQRRKEMWAKVGAAEMVHFNEARSLMLRTRAEQEDLAVISHETTHQLAGTTGLLPANVFVPKWLGEGLAYYFESPRQTSWAGIGAVNSECLALYRFFRSVPGKGSLAAVVGDEVFFDFSNPLSNYRSFALGWALTHFLMDKYFDKLILYCRRIGEMPPDFIFDSRALNALFDSCFEVDRGKLESEWRTYMNNLHDDFSKALIAFIKKNRLGK